MKFTTVRFCLLLAIILFLFGCNGPSQVTGSAANSMKTPDEAARKALESLPRLITEANYQSMNFSSLDEVKSTQLGAAVPRHTISYDALLSMQPGATFSSLFTKDEQFVYPLKVGDAIKSTVSVSKRGEDWQISAIGDSFLAGMLSSTTGENLELIAIPGLSLDFGAIRQGEDWTLIPAQDYSQLHLTKGTAVKASAALPSISQYAKEFDKQYGEQIRSRKLVR